MQVSKGQLTRVAAAAWGPLGLAGIRGLVELNPLLCGSVALGLTACPIAPLSGFDPKNVGPAVKNEDEQSTDKGGCSSMGSIGLAGIRGPVELNLLLLEVSSVLLIHQHQVQEVLDAELVVHRLVGGGEVVGGQEQPAWGFGVCQCQSF